MPQRTHILDAMIQNGQWGSQLRLVSMQKVMADNAVIEPLWSPVLYLSAAGAVDVLLPLATLDVCKFLTFFIRNVSSGANTITLKDSTDTTTIQALAQNKAAIVHCDGVTWRPLAFLA